MFTRNGNFHLAIRERKSFQVKITAELPVIIDKELI
jgi:hypothetical protein